MPILQSIRKIFPLSKRSHTRFERRVDRLRRFVSYERTACSPPIENVNLDRLRIAFVIPDFEPGAGGHMTIFRIARYLEEFGHEVSFLIQNPSVHMSGSAASRTINDHFQPFAGSVKLFHERTPEERGDALIATDRFTCYPVEAMSGFVRKFYLVQDYEPFFYPVGSDHLLTEATYKFDFDCLCAGDWLHEIMTAKYGRWSMVWPLAFDRSIYKEPDSGTRANNRIAFYARWVTERRAVELAYFGLEVLKKRGVEFEVDFFGLELGKIPLGVPCRDHGVLSGPELAQLYREATVGLVFSATNHSLVNKEMMACGLPVVDLDRENVRAIFPEGTMEFAEPEPEKIADVLEAMLTQPDRRARIRESAANYVRQFNWRDSAALIEGALKERVAFARGKKVGSWSP